MPAPDETIGSQYIISVRGHDCHSRYGLLRPSSFDEKFLPFGVVALSVIFGLVPGFISS